MAGPLTPEECHALADALGDSPETVISVHLLRRGLCRAYVAGSLPDDDAVVVQSLSLPKEPTCQATSAEALWELLRLVRGWKHIHVAQSLAEPLGAVIERETGAGVRYYGDVYHTLTSPATTFSNTEVQQLALPDASLVAEYQSDPGEPALRAWRRC